jgi:hypothetical protein
VVDGAGSDELGQGFTPGAGGHEEQWSLSHGLLQELQGLRPFPTGAGVLGYNDVIRLRAELLSALRQVQDDIRADDKPGFLELLQAVVYDLSIAVDEQDAERTAPVKSCALQTEARRMRPQIVLSAA